MMALVSLLAACASWLFIYVWSMSAWPLLSRRRWMAIAVLAILWLAPNAVFRWRGMSGAYNVVMLTSMTLTLASPLLGLVVLISRALRAPASAMKAVDPGASRMTRRQVVEATSGIVLMGTAGSVLGWGYVRGRHAFQIDELAVRIGGLPRSLDGYVIAQISDIHTGAAVGEPELAEGLARVREVGADLLVVTGDLVDFDARFAPIVARRLADVPVRDGVVACLGNHDYYAGRDKVIAALREVGIDVLVDRGRIIRGEDGGGFALLGVDDLVSVRWGRDGPQLGGALATVPAHLPKILLSHQPDSIERWPNEVALQLSGHTHGGQINPLFRPADLVFRYVSGVYQVGVTTLYVNRGFGTVGPPSRVGAPPEVTRIVLVSA